MFTLGQNKILYCKDNEERYGQSNLKRKSTRKIIFCHDDQARKKSDSVTRRGEALVSHASYNMDWPGHAGREKIT